MDQKRLLLALVFSFAVLGVFTFIQDKFLPHPQPQPVASQSGLRHLRAQSRPAPRPAPPRRRPARVSPSTRR